MASSSNAPSTNQSTAELTEFVQHVEGKWDVQTFFQPNVICNVKVASPLPYIFFIGTPASEKPTHENSLSAKAVLSQVGEDINITFSILEPAAHPQWKVTAHVETLELVNGNAIRVMDPRNSGIYSPAILSSVMKSCTVPSNKVDMMFHNIVCPLISLTEAAAAAKENHLGFTTIAFKLKCTISRPKLHREPPNALELYGFQFVNDFEDAFNNPSTADVEIKVMQEPGKSFYCHKTVLAIRSPVFQAMFKTSMKETQDNVVEINDISADAMAHFLSFLYCGRFQDESWIQSLPQLANAAEMYCIKSLKELCNVHLIKSVTSKNAVAIAALATRLKLPGALADIGTFIAKNSGDVCTLNRDDPFDTTDT